MAVRNEDKEVTVTALLAILGIIAGGVIGFMQRPEIPWMGKLPLGTVISGGSGLTGFNAALKPFAAQSQEILMIGTVIGGIVGLILGLLMQNIMGTSQGPGVGPKKQEGSHDDDGSVY